MRTRPRTAGGRAADIEHRVQHSRHRARGAGAHRYQKRPPPVAKLFAGGVFEKFDSFSRGRRQDLAQRSASPLTVAAQRLIGSTKAGGTGRPSAAMRARLAAFPPTISAEYCSADPSPMRAICMLRRSTSLFELLDASRKIGEHVLAQKMPEGRQPIGRALERAGEFENRQAPF